MDPTGKRIEISVIEKPDGFSAKKIADFAKSFIAEIYSDVHEKMVERSVFPLKKSAGWKYIGVRLEAHQRNKTLPANKFSFYTNQFSANFATYGAKVNVTLK